MNINRVLVTGARGFVGSAIVRRLEKKYGRLLLVEREKPRQSEQPQNKSESVFAVDITKRDSVLHLKKIGVVDALIHSAGLAHQFEATSRESFQSVNVLGTGNVLELARMLRVKHFILISSVSVYGHDASKNTSDDKLKIVHGITETAECQPEDFYAESKLDGEKLARRFCAENNIKLTVLRLATVIGEEDRGNFLHLIRQIDRRRFVWIGEGVNHKSLIHREDVAEACLRILEKSDNDTENYKVFNVSADFLSMREIVEIISRKLERKIPPVRIPAAYVSGFFRFGAKIVAFPKIKRTEKTIAKWLAEDVYSAEAIRREYGFVPRISAGKAIEREVEWYMAIN